MCMVLDSDRKLKTHTDMENDRVHTKSPTSLRLDLNASYFEAITACYVFEI